MPVIFPAFQSSRLPAFAVAAGFSAVLVHPGLGHAADATAADQDGVSTVVVTDQRADAPEGTADSGYRVTTANVGPLGKVAVKDLPFSINSVSSGQIDNMQASSASEALRYNPPTGSN